jgi:5,10-methylenetetrahydromethanopterin reductase
VFERYLERLAGYLRGDEVDLAGKPSRLHWLARASQPKVPLDVAATGPKVIAAAARHADRITFAVGADPERIRWGMDVARQARTDAGLDPDGLGFGAYVNVVPHPDVTTAAELARGTVATIAHFSGMAGSTGEGQKPEDREVFERLHENYDRPHHTMGRAGHTAVIDDEFAQRFAVLGPPEQCLDRLRALEDAGINRFVLIGPSIDSDPDERRRATQLTVQEVLPALQGR